MRRKVSEFGTFIGKDELRKLFVEGSPRGRVVITKIGDEHDGHQFVMRLTVHQRLPDFVEISVKEFVWDDGGLIEATSTPRRRTTIRERVALCGSVKPPCETASTPNG